jgi:hypothetical protein
VLAKQRRNLTRFTSHQSKARLKSVLDFLQHGKADALIETILPKVEKQRC